MNISFAATVTIGIIIFWHTSCRRAWLVNSTLLFVLLIIIKLYFTLNFFLSVWLHNVASKYFSCKIWVLFVYLIDYPTLCHCGVQKAESATNKYQPESFVLSSYYEIKQHKKSKIIWVNIYFSEATNVSKIVFKVTLKYGLHRI